MGSQEVQNFEQIVNQNSESMARAFSSTDENKDGTINKFGFNQAILSKGAMPERTRLSITKDTDNIFGLIADLNGEFKYAEYMIDLNPNYIEYFPKQVHDITAS